MTYLPTSVEWVSPTAPRDLLHPFQGTRQDTGEPFWLMPSGDLAGQYYLLTLQGEQVCCSCQEYEQHQQCPHTAAVLLALQPQPAGPTPSNRPSSTLLPHPMPRTEQERSRVEAADRRDRALLWTDDRPFSIWKE